MNKLLLSISMVITLQAFSQVQGEIETTFTPAITTLGSVIVQDDGKIVLANDVTVTGSGPKRLNSDGTLDASFTANSSGGTKLLLTHSTGYYCVAMNKITQIDNSGAILNNNNATLYGIGGDIDGGTINSAVKLADGSLIIGGHFDQIYSNVSSANVNRIVKLNQNMSFNSSFTTTIGTGFNNDVKCLAVDTVNNKIYVGGTFTSFNGNSVNGICRLNADGTFDSSFDPGTGFSVPTEYPDFMKVMHDGRLLVSGQTVTTYNGNSLPYNNMLDYSGSANANFTYSLGGYITDMEEISEEVMLIVGNGFNGDINYRYSTTGANTNYNGKDHFTFPAGFGVNNNVSNTLLTSITKVENGIYLLGGTFSTFSGSTHEGLVKVNICDNDLDLSSIITWNNGVLSSSITGTSYSWLAYDYDTEENIPISNNTDPSITPTVPGMYQVIVTDGTCTYKSQFLNLSNLSISDLETSVISVFPNPASDLVTLNNLTVGTTLQFTDMTGKTVLETSVSTEEMTIDLNALNGGIYFVHIMNNSEVSTSKKLVISK